MKSARPTSKRSADPRTAWELPCRHSTKPRSIFWVWSLPERPQRALAGATPYLRLFALASGGVFLARGALADQSGQRMALCRFFADNMAGETRALCAQVIDGAEALLAAGQGLVSA